MTDRPWKNVHLALPDGTMILLSTNGDHIQMRTKPFQPQTVELKELTVPASDFNVLRLDADPVYTVMDALYDRDVFFAWVDKLEAGRSADSFIAEYVLGWTQEWMVSEWFSETEGQRIPMWTDGVRIPPCSSQVENVPLFTNNIREAWSLIHRIEKDFGKVHGEDGYFRFYLELFDYRSVGIDRDSWEAGWRIEEEYSPDTERWVGLAESQALAICKAALKRYADETV
jgi:hypothetical protein